MSYFLELFHHSFNKIKLELNLIKKATSVGASNLAATSDLAFSTEQIEQSR